MSSVSNIAIGAHLAGNAAVKARHGMNEAIARLSTGNRAMYGGDAAGHGAGLQFRAEGKYFYVHTSLQEVQRMVSLSYKLLNRLYLKLLLLTQD